MGISQWQNEKEWEYLDRDMFGQTPKKISGGYLEWKIKHRYRPSDSEDKCKNCNHHILRVGFSKKYHKCELMGMSMCSSSDIRVGHVCDLYKKEEG